MNVVHGRSVVVLLVVGVGMAVDVVEAVRAEDSSVVVDIVMGGSSMVVDVVVGDSSMVVEDIVCVALVKIVVVQGREVGMKVWVTVSSWVPAFLWLVCVVVAGVSGDVTKKVGGV